MPFGKFRGVPVARLPRDYLQFLVAKCELSGPLRTEVYRALGIAPPPVPIEAESVEEIQDRVFRDIMSK